jgi:hypothetical protein
MAINRKIFRNPRTQLIIAIGAAIVLLIIPIASAVIAHQKSLFNLDPITLPSPSPAITEISVTPAPTPGPTSKPTPKPTPRPTIAPTPAPLNCEGATHGTYTCRMVDNNNRCYYCNNGAFIYSNTSDCPSGCPQPTKNCVGADHGTYTCRMVDNNNRCYYCNNGSYIYSDTSHCPKGCTQ